jgi:hypothetical protein
MIFSCRPLNIPDDDRRNPAILGRNATLRRSVLPVIVVAAKCHGIETNAPAGRWSSAHHVARPEIRYSAKMNGDSLTTALEFLDKYNGAVTAVATAFIAIFTIVLVFVTGRQARLTTAALNLARQEFVATHRPRVIVRYIQGPFENEEGGQFYCVAFVNIGANRAIIEAFGADLAKRSGETDRWVPPGFDAVAKGNSTNRPHMRPAARFHCNRKESARSIGSGSGSDADFSRIRHQSSTLCGWRD